MPIRAVRSATFLPEVAPHEGWTRQQTIDALIRKAGYGGAPSAALRASLSVTRYQSSAVTITYDEYYAQKQVPCRA
jgi:AMME syndrome candidate gene 1 protein